MNNTVIIYALCDPGTNDVRYVGKTFRHTKRIAEHLREARGRTVQTPKARWLRKLLPLQPRAVVLEECSRDDWEDAERQWIAVMRQQGVRLTNLCDGGETTALEGRHHTEESKAKMRAAALADGRGYWRYRPPGSGNKGKTVSDSTREKLRASHLGQTAWNKGKPWSEEAKAKLSAAHIGKPSGRKGQKATPETIAKLRASHLGLPSGNKGKAWTPDMRARMSEIKLAQHRSKAMEGDF